MREQEKGTERERDWRRERCGGKKRRDVGQRDVGGHVGGEMWGRERERGGMWGGCGREKEEDVEERQREREMWGREGERWGGGDVGEGGGNSNPDEKEKSHSWFLLL